MDYLEMNKPATGKAPHCLIKKDTLIDLIKMNTRLSKMVLMLQYVCDAKKVEITLTSEEVCELLKIKPDVLDECRRKNWIKCWKAGSYSYYKAYDIVILAERIGRRKMLRTINKIPVINI